MRTGQFSVHAGSRLRGAALVCRPFSSERTLGALLFITLRKSIAHRARSYR